MNHLWNWVHIGPEWYACDSTSSVKTNLLLPFDEKHFKTYTYYKEPGNRYIHYDFPFATKPYNYVSWLGTIERPSLTQLEATDSGSIGSNLRWTLKDGV